MSDPSSTGFWAEGPERLNESLIELRSKVEDLKRRITQAPSQTEKARLELEMERLLKEYQPTDDEAENCLHLLG